MRLAILVLTAAFVLGLTRPLAWGVEIEFLTPELPWAVADKGYLPPPFEVRVSGKCPLGGVGYTLAGGKLPPGIQLSRLGYLSGVPLHTGSFEFGVQASNGCSWTAKRFILVVTGEPIFTLKPARFEFQWITGEAPPPEQILHVSATWPRLPYQIFISTEGSEVDWLKATPEHGFTPREGSAMDEDQVHVRIDTSRLKPGHYSAALSVSAWQAPSPSPIAVDLSVIAK
jgi:hypothetical protein